MPANIYMALACQEKTPPIDRKEEKKKKQQEKTAGKNSRVRSSFFTLCRKPVKNEDLSSNNKILS